VTILRETGTKGAWPFSLVLVGVNLCDAKQLDLMIILLKNSFDPKHCLGLKKKLRFCVSLSLLKPNENLSPRAAAGLVKKINCVI